MHQRLFVLLAMLVVASPVQPSPQVESGREGLQLTMYSATTLWSVRLDDDSYAATGTVLLAYRFDLGNEVEVADSATVDAEPPLSSN